MKALIFRSHLDWSFVSRASRWHLRWYLSGRGLPLSAGVYLTSACNCKCVMCDIWMDKGRRPDIYPRQAQERDIQALARAGCYYYSISGGEPTLVKDLTDRLTVAARHLPYVHVVTNGLTMGADLARALGQTGIKEISLSLDGSRRIHDLLRGIDGAFVKTMAALDHLEEQAPHLQIVVNSVVTPYNIDGLRELRRLLAPRERVRFKLLPMTFHPLFLTGDRQGLVLDLEPAPVAAVDAFLDEAMADPRNVNSRVFLARAKRYLAGERDLLREQKRCLYPHHAMEFDAKGNAFPCLTGMAGQGGRPPETDLGDYLASPDYRSRQKALEACDGCRNSMMLCYFEPRLNFPINHLLRNR
ncbi:MAG: radical SAM protein [Magnetococcales bacterium]|nr:radical SAM protein [Magnetococcales bacterium]